VLKQHSPGLSTAQVECVVVFYFKPNKTTNNELIALVAWQSAALSIHH
jgi:hypothetical protein